MAQNENSPAPKTILQEFKEFAVKGNMIDLAVGIVVGATFNTVVKSLVDDIIMPPIGWIIGRVDFPELYLNLSSVKYASLAEAKAAGAPTINYGLFLNNVITFLITAWVVFLTIKVINRLRRLKKVT